MEEGRIESELLFINLANDPGRKQYKVAVFEDIDGNRYEYSYANTSKFLKLSFPNHYIPLLENRKHKKYIRISFHRKNKGFNPITGKQIYQMSYPKVIGENA